MGRPTNSKMQSQKPKAVGPMISGGGGVARVKTDGRIGSPTPKSYVTGGMTVDNNSRAQSHGGGLGKAAQSHMSPRHGGGVWSPRVSKARAMAIPYPREHGHPINVQTPSLKKVKPA